MTVYLLHFDKPLGDLDNPRGQARHYIGTAHDVETRLRQHRKGYGARITQVLWERGIDFKLARVIGVPSYFRFLKSRPAPLEFYGR